MIFRICAWSRSCTGMLSNGKVADGSESSLAANARNCVSCRYQRGIRLKASRRVIDMITPHAKISLEFSIVGSSTEA